MVLARLSRSLLFAAVCGIALVLAISPAGAVPSATQVLHGGSPVAPPTAQIGGYSLEEAAQATVHSFAKCDAPPPNLPFRAICALRTGTPTKGGLIASGSAEYSVKAGTYLYTTVADVTDGEPPLGIYPKTNTEALRYWFRHSELGAGRATVKVDNKTVVLPNGNLVGPFEVSPPLPAASPPCVNPLPDLACNDVQMGVFINPLPIGRHHIRTSVTFDGSLIQSPPYELKFYRLTSDFTVTVTRH